MSEKGGLRQRSLGIGGVFKSLTNSLKPASGKVPVVVNAKVVGGTSDMQKLLSQLQSSALPLRVSAAAEITKSLEKYSVSSIPEIWYLVRDLCDPRLAPSVRRVAIKLMIHCIKHDFAEISSRLMYYRDITTYCKVLDSSLDPEFDLFFSALRQLTDDGKEIHDFCIYNHDRNWFAFMLQCFVSIEYLHDLRRKHGDSSDDARLVVSFAEYLGNCFKFNFSIIDEAFISSVLNEVHRISMITEDITILCSLCELVRTITVFAYVPAAAYTTTVFFLCSMAPLDLNLLMISWKAMFKIFCGSPFQALDATMCIFQAPGLEKLRGIDVDHADLKNKSDYKVLIAAMGALTVLENMLLSNGTDEVADSFDIQYKPLYLGLIDCLKLNIAILNSGVLRILDHLFATSEEEKDMHLVQRFSTLFPFYVWYATSDSVFTLLLKLRLNSSQDENHWTAICSSLHERFVSANLVAPIDKLADLYMLHPQTLPGFVVSFVLKFYKDNGMCSTSNALWKKNCKQILFSFYFNEYHMRNSPSMRIDVLQFLMDEYIRSMILTNDDSMGVNFVSLVLKHSYREEDKSVLQYFLHTVLHEFLRTCSISSFMAMLENVQEIVHISHDSALSNSHDALNIPGITLSKLKQNSIDGSFRGDTKGVSSLQELSYEISKCIGHLFVELFPFDSFKSKRVYDFMIEMLAHTIETEAHKTLLLVIRILIRIRSNSEGHLYLGEPNDMSGLATTFKRNTLDNTYSENVQQWWRFPETLEYLPKDFLNRPNKHIMSHPPEAGSTFLLPQDLLLDLSKWLDLIIIVLKDYVHWELYSFTMAHLCSQLFNLSLFWHLKSHVLAIQNIICDQITLKFPKSLAFPLPGIDLNKSDLQIALVRTLSSLIGYHNLFNKQEEENLIKALLFGLGSWQKSAVPCIHLLTICCYETLETLKKYLIPILTKLQTGVTSVYASSSALEFLMALIHVPSLTSNFTTDEFRQVFAICFRYIEHALDTKKRGFEEKEVLPKERYLGHGVDAEVNFNASTHSIELTPLFYQYLLVVSYAVITRWFLKVNLTERSQISSFIVRNILACSGAKDINNLDDMTVSYLDAITRFTYSNIPLKIVTKTTSVSRGSMCRWILGHAIVEINTNVQNGESIITLRRPCGFSAFQITLDPSMLPKTMRILPDKELMLSSHLLLQLFKPLDQGNVSKPLALLDDAFTERAINAFDRIPVVAHHKAGVIYIGPGQAEESEIFANTSGSLEYHRFLNGLGEFVELKSCDSIYVGGLDKENGTDGKYAYFWSDELTHLIYHTTTLMPNSPNDKYFATKKRHIGNNYVNVFFDESGLPFNFNVIRSQFNFLNIVLCPHTIGQGHDACGPQFYKVRTYRRTGVPGIFSTTHYKLISLEQLPHLVRNLVIMSNRFSEIWHDLVDGTYTTNWQMRVKQIKTIREKTLESHKQIQEEQSATSTANISRNTALSFLEQLQPHRAIEKEEPQEQKERFLNGEPDLYSLVEFNSYT